jgi:hypothetical protein
MVELQRREIGSGYRRAAYVTAAVSRFATMLYYVSLLSVDAANDLETSRLSETSEVLCLSI